MRKNLLLLFLSLFVCSYMSAGTITITAPIGSTKVTYGSGAAVGLTGETTTIDYLTTAENPLAFEANSGWTITNVTNAGMSGDKVWRASISGDDQTFIVTAEKAETPVVSTVSFSVYNMSGSDKTFTIQQDGKPIGEDNGWGGYSLSVALGSTITIVPESGYKITDQTYGYSMDISTTFNADGSCTAVINSVNASYAGIYVYTAIDAPEISITANLPSYITAEICTGSLDKIQDLALTSATQYYITSNTAMIKFAAKEGAEITGCTRNGEPVNYNPNQGCYMTACAANDAFVIEAKGPATTVSFAAAARGGITFTLDNVAISVNGEAAQLNGSQLSASVGDVITISPRGGKLLAYATIGTNMPTPDDAGNITFTLSQENQSVVIYGQNSYGLVVNAENASGISFSTAKSSETLSDGLNNLWFTASADLPITIKPTNPGWSITSVEVKGAAISAAADGTYTISELEEYSEISIKAVRNVTASFMLTDPDNKLSATLNGNPIDLSSAATAAPGSILVLTVEDGYAINDLSAGSNAIEEGAGTYTITLTASCMIMGTVAEDASFTISVEEKDAKASVIVDQGGPNHTKLEAGQSYKSEEPVSVTFMNNTSDYDVEFYINGELSATVVKGSPVKETISADAVIKAIKKEVSTSVEINAMPATSSPNGMAGKLTIAGTTWYTFTEIGETVAIEATPASGYKLDYVGYSTDYANYTALADPTSFTLTAEIAEAAASGYLYFKAFFVENTEAKTFEIIGGMATEGRISIRVNGSTMSRAEVEVGQEIEFIAQVYSDFTGSKQLKEVQFNGQSIQSPFIYTITEADFEAAQEATTPGVLTATPVFESTTGIEGIEGDGSLAYLAASDEIIAPAAVDIYSAAGALVFHAEAGRSSIAALPAGLYIAVSGNATLKFAK